jgi:hypothetical protein
MGSEIKDIPSPDPLQKVDAEVILDDPAPATIEGGSSSYQEKAQSAPEQKLEEPTAPIKLVGSSQTSAYIVFQKRY